MKIVNVYEDTDGLFVLEYSGRFYPFITRDKEEIGAYEIAHGQDSKYGYILYTLEELTFITKYEFDGD